MDIQEFLTVFHEGLLKYLEKDIFLSLGTILNRNQKPPYVVYHVLQSKENDLDNQLVINGTLDIQFLCYHSNILGSYDLCGQVKKFIYEQEGDFYYYAVILSARSLCDPKDYPCVALRVRFVR